MSFILTFDNKYLRFFILKLEIICLEFLIKKNIKLLNNKII